MSTPAGIKRRSFLEEAPALNENTGRGDNYNEVKSYQTTELRQNPDGSFSKITRTITSTTKTLFVNSETVTNEANKVNERPLKKSIKE